MASSGSLGLDERMEQLCLPTGTKRHRISAEGPLRMEISPNILDFVSGEIGQDWKRMARLLGILHNDIESIDGKEPLLREKAYQALMKWNQLRTSCSDPIPTLCDALESIERLDIIHGIHERRKAAESGVCRAMSNSLTDGMLGRMHGAKEACRSYHEQMLTTPDLDVYGERRSINTIADLMVSLVTVTYTDADCARMNPTNEMQHHLTRNFSGFPSVEAHNLFDTDRIVLIRGLPGSGKSTFCQYILREWLAGRLWKGQFDFIFYLNAPLVISLLEGAQFGVEASLNVLYPKVFKDFTYDDLKRSSYLVIIDSIDECDVGKICKKSTSNEEAIRQLILSHTEFKRIIVGRPHACDQVSQMLRKYVSLPFTYVEIVGFSSAHLEEYVRKFCRPDTARGTELWKKIVENRSLFIMAHLPVFANIICHILTQDATLTIETMTELYVYAFAVFLTRHLKGPLAESVDCSTFESLFRNEGLLVALLKVSQMAYQNLAVGKIFFTSQDLSLTDIELSLVSSFIVQRRKFLCFAHLTFMEFLSAVYLLIRCFELNQQFIERNHLDRELFTNERFRGVLPMYVGLLGGAAVNSDSPGIIRDFVRPLMGKFHGIQEDSINRERIRDFVYPLIKRSEKNHEIEEDPIIAEIHKRHPWIRRMNHETEEDPMIMALVHRWIRRTSYKIFEHPLCGDIGKLAHGMDSAHLIYLNLTFEFRNAHLLSREVFWENDSMLHIHHHHEFEHLIYFLNNFLTSEGRKIRRLTIEPVVNFSLDELRRLSNCLYRIDCKVGTLHMWDFSNDDESIVFIARSCIFVREVSFFNIQATVSEVWKIFLRHLEEAKQKNELYLERLEMWGCEVDPIIKEQLVQVVPNLTISL